MGLSDFVAEEIRAMMARRRVTGRAMAKRLGVSDAWVSNRLSGRQPIGLDDLERIAEFLGVAVHELLPTSDDEEELQAASRRRRQRSMGPNVHYARFGVNRRTDSRKGHVRHPASYPNRRTSDAVGRPRVRGFGVTAHGDAA